MSDFTISWTHEAEDWLQYHKKDSMESGYTFTVGFIYTPTVEEKSAIETELYTFSEILKKFAIELIKLKKKTNYNPTMKIYFKCKGSFYVRFWYEPRFEATDFIIFQDEKDKETARIIFKDVPSIEYSSKYDYS